ncbi:MAG: MHFG family PEP-CTERM protein [Caldimonas sp.]
MPLEPAIVIRSICQVLAVVALAWTTADGSEAKSLSAAPATVTVDACAWDRPGHNPFMGDLVEAVDRYRDIPVDVRERLKARMTVRDYDDMVSIRRDSITGKGTYGNAISDMHFGTNQVCRTVSRAAWAPDMQERGLVYCESGHCILVPTVCRNVSRIARAEVDHEHAEGPAEPDDVVAFVPPLGEPLYHPVYEPPVPLHVDGSPTFASSASSTEPLDGVPGAGGTAGMSGLPARYALAAGPIVSTASPVSTLAPAAPVGTEDSLFPAAPPIPDEGAFPPAPPIALTPIPEPETWAFMLLGLAGLIALQHRRRLATAPAR